MAYAPFPRRLYGSANTDRAVRSTAPTLKEMGRARSVRFWGRLEGGLDVLSLDGTVVRGLASWDGIGSSDYSGYTLQAIANIPLN